MKILVKINIQNLHACTSVQAFKQALMRTQGISFSEACVMNEYLVSSDTFSVACRCASCG